MLSALNEAEVEYLVVGAYAMASHGCPRATGDKHSRTNNRALVVYVPQAIAKVRAWPGPSQQVWRPKLERQTCCVRWARGPPNAFAESTRSGCPLRHVPLQRQSIACLVHGICK